jgi:hypothetical protein
MSVSVFYLSCFQRIQYKNMAKPVIYDVIHRGHMVTDILGLSDDVGLVYTPMWTEAKDIIVCTNVHVPGCLVWASHPQYIKVPFCVTQSFFKECENRPISTNTKKEFELVILNGNLRFIAQCSLWRALSEISN